MLGLGFRYSTFLIPQTMEGEDLTQPPPTGNNGIIGTIDLHGSGGSTDLTDHVHLLPCSVKHDGPQPVSDYFKPGNTGEVVDEMVVKEAFFRGRKLQGTTVSIPHGYCGFVLGKKMKGPKSGDSLDSNDWEVRARFGNLTYWNHDDVPSNEDALPRCFHWFSVADALHRPVTAEDLAFASIAQDHRRN